MPAGPRVLAALDRDALRLARPIAGALALSYLAYGVSYLLTQGTDRSLLLWAWGLTSLGFGTFFVLFPRLRLVRGNLVLGLMAVPVVTDSVLVVSQVRAPIFTAAPALIVLGFGALLLSPRVFVAITVATLAGWTIVVLTDPSPLAWLPGALMLATATAIGSVAQAGRYRSRVRLEEAREAVREAERSLALDAVRTAFINDAAHQLNTPLTPIVVNAHTLASGRLGPLTPAQRTAVEAIQRNAEDLRVLSKAMLGAARLRDDEPSEAWTPDEVRARLAKLTENAARTGIRVEERGTLHAPGLPRLPHAVVGLLVDIIAEAPSDSVVEVTADHAPERHLVRIVHTTAKAGELRDPEPRLSTHFARVFAERHGGDLRVVREPGSLQYLLTIPRPRPSPA